MTSYQITRIDFFAEIVLMAYLVGLIYQAAGVI